MHTSCCWLAWGHSCDLINPVMYVGWLQGFFHASGRSSGVPVACCFPTVYTSQAVAKLTLNVSDIARSARIGSKSSLAEKIACMCVRKEVKNQNKAVSCFKVKLQLWATRPWKVTQLPSLSVAISLQTCWTQKHGNSQGGHKPTM